MDGEAWTGLIWLRTGTGRSRLWMRSRTLGFHKIRGISWLAKDLLASQEGLCSMELVKNSRLLDSVPDSLDPFSILTSYFCEIFKMLFSFQILNIPGGLLPLNSWTEISYTFIIFPIFLIVRTSDLTVHLLLQSLRNKYSHQRIFSVIPLFCVHHSKCEKKKFHTYTTQMFLPAIDS